MVFTGDAIPAPEDIPIYVNKQASLETLDRLASLEAGGFVRPGTMLMIGRRPAR